MSEPPGAPLPGPARRGDPAGRLTRARRGSAVTGNSCEDVGYDKYAWKSSDWRGGNGGLATCTFPETHKGERFPAGDGADGYWGTKAPERFWNCADVKIFSNNDNPPPPVPDPPVEPPIPPPVIPPEPEPERPNLDPETSAGSAGFSTYFDGERHAFPRPRVAVRECGGLTLGDRPKAASRGAPTRSSWPRLRRARRGT